MTDSRSARGGAAAALLGLACAVAFTLAGVGGTALAQDGDGPRHGAGGPHAPAQDGDAPGQDDGEDAPERTPAAAEAPTDAAPALTADNLAAIRDHVLPDDDERAFLEVPWRPTLWEAVREAHEEDRPLLVWAMNGHPLGHT